MGSVLVSPVVGLMVSVGAVGLLSVGTEASSVGEVASVLGAVGTVWVGMQAARVNTKQRAKSRDRVFFMDFIFIPPSVLDFLVRNKKSGLAQDYESRVPARLYMGEY